MKTKISVIILSFFALSFAAHSDIVILKDGTIIQGKFEPSDSRQVKIVVDEVRIPSDNVKTEGQVGSVYQIITKDRDRFGGIHTKIAEGKVRHLDARSISRNLTRRYRSKVFTISKWVADSYSLPTVRIQTEDGKVLEKELYGYNKETLVYVDLKDNNTLAMNQLGGVQPRASFSTGIVKLSADNIEKAEIIDGSIRKQIIPEPDDLRADAGGYETGWQPRFGLQVIPVMPMGAIGGVLGMAIGFNANFSVNLPIHKVKAKAFNLRRWIADNGFHMRAGLSVGLRSFSATSDQFTATVGNLPIMLNTYFYRRIRKPVANMRLAPYFRLGTGVSMNSLTKSFNEDVVLEDESERNVSTSGPSFTIEPALGIDIEHRSMKQLVFNIDISYMMQFETTSGTFLNFGVGAAYKF